MFDFVSLIAGGIVCFLMIACYEALKDIGAVQVAVAASCALGSAVILILTSAYPAAYSLLVGGILTTCFMAYKRRGRRDDVP
jgi:hypothetical protein